ncbi:MAG: hypothetical protein ACLP0Q_08965, partial [Rhodoblastus sp.]
MFFVASKLLWFLASPLHFLLIALGAGLFFAPRRAFGRRLAIAAASPGKTIDPTEAAKFYARQREED